MTGSPVRSIVDQLSARTVLAISLGYLWLHRRVGYRYISYYRGIIRTLGHPVLSRVLDRPPLKLPTPEPGDTCIHLLTKSNECLFALWACRSLLERLDQPIPLYIHDDGSLTEADGAMIEAVLPGVRLLWRTEADALARQSFADLPNCLAFRRSNILSLKLFDPWFVQATGDLILLDSDILFFRRPTELIDWLKHPETRRNLWNMGRPQEVKQCPTAGFNSGLGLLMRSLMSFQRVEDLLSGDFQGTSTWLMEQEIYRQLSAAAGMEALPATYHVPEGRGAPPGALVAKHYVGLVRGLFIGEGLLWLLRDGRSDAA